MDYSIMPQNSLTGDPELDRLLANYSLMQQGGSPQASFQGMPGLNVNPDYMASYAGQQAGQGQAAQGGMSPWAIAGLTVMQTLPQLFDKPHYPGAVSVGGKSPFQMPDLYGKLA